MTTVSRAHPASKPTTFKITFEIGEDRYAVTPISAHPEVAQSAFRLRKITGGQEVYDVRLDADDDVDCDCLGFTYHRKPCKHIRALVAAQMLPVDVLTPCPF